MCFMSITSLEQPHNLEGLKEAVFTSYKIYTWVIQRLNSEYRSQDSKTWSECNKLKMSRAVQCLL
jgi:hypothetical protein